MTNGPQRHTASHGQAGQVDQPRPNSKIGILVPQDRALATVQRTGPEGLGLAPRGEAKERQPSLEVDAPPALPAHGEG